MARLPAAAGLLAVALFAAAPLLASACTVSSIGDIKVAYEPFSKNLSATAYAVGVSPSARAALRCARPAARLGRTRARRRRRSRTTNRPPPTRPAPRPACMPPPSLLLTPAPPPRTS
jgi:hypothetical protein